MDDDTMVYLAGPALSVPSAHISAWSRLKLRLEDVVLRLGVQEVPIATYQDRAKLAWQRAPRERVRMLGYVDDVRAWISAVDVVVFAGAAPHYPRPVYEAWAMKKPVVVFDVDGIRQKVEDGIDGIVVKDISGKALGKAVQRLLDEPETMMRLGENGYGKAKSLCDPVQIAQQVKSIYDEILT
jgi:glycosyltransferase involved in cell wall biosynthesis